MKAEFPTYPIMLRPYEPEAWDHNEGCSNLINITQDIYLDNVGLKTSLHTQHNERIGGCNEGNTNVAIGRLAEDCNESGISNNIQWLFFSHIITVVYVSVSCPMFVSVLHWWNLLRWYVSYFLNFFWDNHASSQVIGITILHDFWWISTEYYLYL